MAVAGTIVVELQANTAQFHQEMGRASTGLQSISRESGASERALSSFAAKGFGSIIPAAQGAEFAISKVIDKALHAGGALKGFGIAGAAVGAFFLAREAGQRIREEIDNWLALGETINTTTERLKTEADEQEKFAQKRKAAVGLLINLETQLAQTRSQAISTALKTSGDSFGAVGVDTRAALAQAAADKQIRDRSIVEATDAGDRRNQLLLVSEQQLAAARFKINEDYIAAIRKLNDDTTAKNLQNFTTETSNLLDQIQKRVDERKRLESQTSGLVQSGTITDPQANTAAIAKGFNAEAESLGFLLKEGRPWRDLQEQIFAKDQEFQSKGFSGFASAVDAARVRIGTIGASADSIAGSLDQMRQKIAEELSKATGQGAQALTVLIGKANDLRTAFDQAAAAAGRLADAVVTDRSGPPTPTVGPSVDLGPQP